MKTKRRTEDDGDPLAASLEEIKSLLQDLLIFQSIQAGITLHDVRKMMKLNLNRVTHVSKALKKAKKETGE